MKDTANVCQRVSGFSLLARFAIDSQRIYRRQAISLGIAALTPGCAMCSFLRGHNPCYLDLTPFALALSGVAVMWGIVRYRLLDIVPIAHDIVIQNMGDGVLVMDTHQRILDPMRGGRFDRATTTNADRALPGASHRLVAKGCMDVTIRFFQIV